jgi:hypothetical protein
MMKFNLRFTRKPATVWIFKIDFKEMKKFRIFFILILVTVCTYGQGGGSFGITDPVAAATGNTFVSWGKGIYAIGKNPANIGKVKSVFTEFSLVLPIPNFNGNVSLDYMTIDEFNYYFGGSNGINNSSTGKFLTESDKLNLRNLFRSGQAARFNLNFDLFAFSVNVSDEIGTIAFAIKDQASLTASFPQSLVDLFLFGNQIGLDYTFQDSQLQSWYLRNYSISYAKDFNKLTLGIFSKFTAGISFKYIQGFVYSSIERAESKFLTSDKDYSIEVKSDFLMRLAFSPDLGVNYDFDEDVEKKSNVSAFPAPSGNGFGIDIGFNAELNDYLTAALSVTDIGGINWTSETVVYSANKNFILNDITEETSVDSLTDIIKGEGKYVDGFKTGLATSLHFGIACDVEKLFRGKIRGKLKAALEYHQGFNNLPTNTTTPRVALGVEYRLINLLPIRTGISIGGIDGFNWGFGFGIDSGLLEMNFATSDLHHLLDGNSANRVGIHFGSRWRI